MYKRKTEDEWEIQGYYGPESGWECVTVETSWPAAKEQRKCYRDNEPGIPFRTVKKRVKKEETPCKTV